MLNNQTRATLKYIENLPSIKKLDYISLITLLRVLDINRQQSYDIYAVIDFMSKNIEQFPNTAANIILLVNAHSKVNRKKATVKQWLKIRHLKQVDLAAHLGINRHQMSTYLSKGINNYKLIRSIADFLDVEIEQLILPEHTKKATSR